MSHCAVKGDGNAGVGCDAHGGQNLFVAVVVVEQDVFPEGTRRAVRIPDSLGQVAAELQQAIELAVAAVDLIGPLVHSVQGYSDLIYAAVSQLLGAAFAEVAVGIDENV